MNYNKNIYAIIKYISVLLAVFININAKDEPLKIKYLGNMGVMISSGTSKILIDALHQNNPWDFAEPSKATVDDIINQRGEFKDTRILLATHNHADHFNDTLTYRFLKRSGRQAVLTQQSADDISKSFADFKNIGTQIIVTDNSEYGISNLSVENIIIKGLNISHGNDTQNTGCIIDINGFKIFHSGDAMPAKENFAGYNLAEENLDVAILPVWFIDEYELVNSFNAKQVIYIHIHPDKLDEYGRYLKNGNVMISNLNEEYIYSGK